MLNQLLWLLLSGYLNLGLAVASPAERFCCCAPC